MKYNPYNIDFNYEHRTYKHIGKDYGNIKTANKGLIKNLFRWLRRMVFNRSERCYKFCNTHSEWELYIEKKFFCDYGKNGQNIMKYLNVKKRKAALLLEGAKTVLIPLYIAVFSTMPSIFSEDDWEKNGTYISASMVIFIFLTIVIALGLIWKYSHMLNFYQDFMECLKKECSK